MMFLIAMMFVACTDAQHSKQVLEGAGYTDIEITGYSFFGCSEDDDLHTAFVATGPTGERVSGVVCCGLFFKGCTIRY